MRHAYQWTRAIDVRRGWALSISNGVARVLVWGGGMTSLETYGYGGLRTAAHGTNKLLSLVSMVVFETAAYYNLNKKLRTHWGDIGLSCILGPFIIFLHSINVET